MTDRDIEIMATEYAKLCDPLNQTLEKQADVRMGFIAGYKEAIKKPEPTPCNHPDIFVATHDGVLQCKACGKAVKEYTGN